jgi:TPP-dependent pyruvate/acetoin dehydrogenase alpha subunit
VEIPRDKLLWMFRNMVTIRQFEEGAGHLAQAARIPPMVHLYAGEEAVATGTCGNLNPDDYITSTHRGHGHLIAKGGDIRRMYAELFAKATGYNKGKGGSMHIADLDLGILGANGIVGAGAPIAVGAGFAAKYRGTSQACACFFGDGATNIGPFHEAANMAAVFKLPVVFVCENNLYGEWTRQDRSMLIVDVSSRAAAYGMPGVTVDGMDVLAVYEAASEAVDRARRGDGPTMLECKTYRYYDHVGVSYGEEERPAEEREYWLSRDPIVLFRERLASEGILSPEDAERIIEEVKSEVEEAIAFAEGSPDPAPESLLEDVYTES